MGRSLTTLQRLLPPGRAWTRSVNAAITDLLTAIAAEFDRVEARGADLLREALPATATELLEDWERITQADSCVELASASLETRRRAVVARLIGQAPTLELVLEVMNELGYAVSFEFWSQFRVGRSAVGEALYGDAWAHTLGPRYVPISAEEDAAMRCIVEGLQHLHVFVLWSSSAEYWEDGDGGLWETHDGQVWEATA